jgi:hypothetical protein
MRHVALASGGQGEYDKVVLQQRALEIWSVLRLRNRSFELQVPHQFHGIKLLDRDVPS